MYTAEVQIYSHDNSFSITHFYFCCNFKNSFPIFVTFFLLCFARFFGINCTTDTIAQVGNVLCKLVASANFQNGLQ